MITTLLHTLYPEKLRTRIILLAIFLVCISTFIIAYMVEKEGLELLLQEKQQKLLTVAHVLDVELANSFNNTDSSLSREAQIKQLTAKLSPNLEHLLLNTLKIGAGYYHKALDAIIVYGPKSEHGDKVGLTIAIDHPGREVMATAQPMVWSGPQVRGNIMNAMVPIVRHQKVLGYIWANELTQDINAQAVALGNRIILVCAIGLLCSIGLALLLSRRLNNDIDVIKQGLNELSFDLHTKLPPLYKVR